MLEDFQNHIESSFPFLRESKVVLAISGGVDSVVLAYLCHKIQLDIALAHCNFNLRGEESDEDETFVLELGELLNIETFIQNFDTTFYAKEHKVSVQMAARELRYSWFQDLASQLSFDYILTAHHADDNLETFLINFTRGTGLNGLTGIPEINENIVRPLLPFSREQVEAYAKSNGIKWREDSSNSSRKYLRNKLRHEVVPILKEINPQLLDSFKHTVTNLNDTADIVEESLNAVAKRAIVDIQETGITYKISEFKKVNNSKAYLFEMFKDFGFTEWNDVVNLLDAETGKYVMSSAHKLTKHREFLILQERNNAQHSELVSESKPIIFDEVAISEGKLETPIGILFFDEADTLIENTKDFISVDYDTLSFPLEMRPWKTGDIIHPIGMKGSKKVSKYLKDEKLTPVEKDNTWVLVSNNEVVWVIGKRANNRFKVTNKTKSTLRIELKK